jgi:hypothetical protein
VAHLLWNDLDAEVAVTVRVERLDRMQINTEAPTPRFSSAALLQAIQPVGTLACRFSLKWPRDRIAEPPLLKSGTEYATRSWRLMKSLGIVANLAQALTLPAGLLAFGTDIMHLTQHIGTAMQVVGRDALGVGMEVSRQFYIGPGVPEFRPPRPSRPPSGPEEEGTTRAITSGP